MLLPRARAEAMKYNVPPLPAPGTRGLGRLPLIPHKLFVQAAAGLWAMGKDTNEIAASLSRESLREGMRGVDEHEVVAALDEIRAVARQVRAA